MAAPTTVTPTTSTVAIKPSVSFRTKLSIVSTALALVPLVVVGATVIKINADSVRETHRDLQLAALEDVARTIDGEFAAAEMTLEAIGRSLTDTRIDESARLALATNLLSGSEALDNATVYDAGGRRIDTMREPRARELQPPEELGEDLRLRARNDNVATGAVAVQAGEPRAPVVIPIRARERVTGYVAALVSLAGVQKRVERLAAARFGDLPDALFVVDEQLRLLCHPDRGRARSLASARDLGGLAGVDVRALRADVARSGEFRSPAGRPMVGSMIGLTRRPWTVVTQVPRRVAYAPLYDTRRVVLGVLGGALVVALLVALVLAGRITAPVRKLSEFAGQLAARRFQTRVEVGTRDELSVLASAMSAAAADLEASEKRIHEEVAIRTDLGRYLPAPLVDRVVRREQDMGLGGRRCHITVLFADVVAFTPLTERLGAEEVVKLLNELFTILTEIVFRHGGTVDKFMGDCVMAFFGAPTPQEDHAARALRCAEDMMRWLEVGNARWQERHGVELQLAIGVNSGEAIVGNVGSETRMEYTAIGDVVNVAARLEAIARPQQILVTRATRELAGDAVRFVEIGPHTLAGRVEPVQLSQVKL
jgi:class 3 adenylate cyclase